MEGAGPLEGALDTRQPRSREDSPGALPNELLGEARDTVELPNFPRSSHRRKKPLSSCRANWSGSAGRLGPAVSGIG